jgi:hypothetical protein
MIQDQLFTLAEAAREAGIARSTVQRWIARGRLKKQANGMIAWRHVEKCLSRKRTGRPHGERPSRRANLLSEAQLELALPFLQGAEGLRRLKGLLAAIGDYHIQAGRGSRMEEILLTAVERIHLRMTSKPARKRKN